MELEVLMTRVTFLITLVRPQLLSPVIHQVDYGIHSYNEDPPPKEDYL